MNFSIFAYTFRNGKNENIYSWRGDSNLEGYSNFNRKYSKMGMEHRNAAGGSATKGNIHFDFYFVFVLMCTYFIIQSPLISIGVYSYMQSLHLHNQLIFLISTDI